MSHLFWMNYFYKYARQKSQTNRLDRWFESRFADPARDSKSKYLKVAERSTSDISPKAFRLEFLKTNRPVVIRGYGKRAPAMQKWSLDFFRENYGKDSIPVKKIDPKNPKNHVLTKMPLEELITDIEANGFNMASFLVDLFNKNPELREDIGLEYLESLVSRNSWSKIRSTQLFLASGNGTTDFHNEPGLNMYLQVSGSKTWTFVPPNYTHCMYPYIRKDFYYGSSPVDHNLSNIDDYPLFKLAPKYRVTLYPGDVLFSPQWWWHAVDNNETSIAVASRTLASFGKGSLPMSLLNITSKSVWQNYYTIFKTGWNSDKTVVGNIITRTKE